MERKDRDELRAERSLAYQRGLIALTNALGQFKDVTGIDLTDCVDIDGRHMGEAPYLKVTAERLAELTTQIDDVAQDSAVIALKLAEHIHGASPLSNLADYRGISSGPVLSAYRPVPTS